MSLQEAAPAETAVRAVIRAKIRVPISGDRLERPRVEARLKRLLARHRCVVVSATPGAGKTTLVAAVVQSLDRPAAWLTVDWTDAAPGRLVGYLEAALAEAAPEVAGVARDALAAGIPHAESVALLAEAAAGRGVVLVIDELDRLGDAPDAWAVIRALLSHAPDDMGVVLCSRRPLPDSALPGAVGTIGDRELALTVREAAALLQIHGEGDLDTDAVVHATGGWVTGVLFHTWQLGEDVGEEGGSSDPLHGYLSAHILEQLSPENRDFLIATSVLRLVSADRAGALGLPDPASRLASLRAEHIPATWQEGGLVLRCHPGFREYLQECLAAWDAERVRALRLAHGHLLEREGLDEMAAEVMLLAGAPAAALEPAGRAIFEVINRLDFDVAERWLTALAEVEPEGMSPFVMARLMIVLAQEDHSRGLELIERLAAEDTLADVVSNSSAVAVMVGQCYVMAGRYDEMLAVFEQAPHDADYEALRQYQFVYGYEPRPPRPALTGGPLDGTLLAIDYGYGDLSEAVRHAPAGWVQAFSQPWLIQALSDFGRTQRALELYEAVRAHSSAGTSLEAVVGPRALTDAGRREEALEALERGRRRAREGPSLIYELLAGVAEARLRVRLDRDPVAARAALDRIELNPNTHRVGFIGEQTDLWYGCALLLEGRDAEALERLRRSVARMRRSGRRLELPTAAVYLAEAEWRSGNEDEADMAADLALEAARFQGSNHMLLLALADFPAVISRRIDAEPTVDSPWHELGRALRTQDVRVDATARAPVQLLEFGRTAIVVDGAERRPRIAKAYELLAYLLTRPERQAERDELLDALFEGRADESTRAYLRQAIRWLRHVLPGEDTVIVEGSSVWLAERVVVTSESLRLEAALAEAARLVGEDRLGATLRALEPFDSGAYLPGVASEWVEERRRHLAQQANAARYEAAELAFSLHDLDHAEQLIDTVLEAEPLQEAGWRLAMRVASARGDEHGVMRAYERCERALAEVGAEPAATTRQLRGGLIG